MLTLILAGGASRRMGRDKAGIVRPDGTRQIDHLIAIARELGHETLISTNDPAIAPEAIATLPDLEPGQGPLGALASLNQARPGTAALILGCDLFLLDAETPRHLLEAHDPARRVTCYNSRIDGRPEPLCCALSPEALSLASSRLAEDQRCARHFLESLEPQRLELPNPAALDNANSPSELDEAFAKLRFGVESKEIEVLYFASLRETRGLARERVTTLACTAAGLFHELAFLHRWKVRLEDHRVAINDEFADWSDRIRPDDEIVFLPPVSGG